MSKHTKLFPDSVAIVDQAEIQDETFHNVTTILNNGFKDFELGEEAVSLTKGFESFEAEVLRRGGMVKIDSHVVRRMAQLGITFGAWQNQIHALLTGRHPDDVKTDYQVKYDADAISAADGTGTAIVDPATVENQEFSVLVRCPLKGGDNLYVYLPKCVVKQDPAEQQMRLGQQQKPVVTFEGLALQSTEVAAHAAIFSGVDANGVAYIWTGKKTVV